MAFPPSDLPTQIPASHVPSMLNRVRSIASVCLAISLGAFVAYVFFGAFETLIQRAIFVAMISILGQLCFP